MKQYKDMNKKELITLLNKADRNASEKLIEIIDLKNEIEQLNNERKHFIEQTNRLIDKSSEDFKTIRDLQRQIDDLNTTDLSTENFEIKYREDLGYIFFEHNEYGENVSGRIDLDGKKAYDYEGCYNIPGEVKFRLITKGFTGQPIKL